MSHRSERNIEGPPDPPVSLSILQILRVLRVGLPSFSLSLAGQGSRRQNGKQTLFNDVVRHAIQRSERHWLQGLVTEMAIDIHCRYRRCCSDLRPSQPDLLAISLHNSPERLAIYTIRG